jgi:hypothetical protein
MGKKSKSKNTPKPTAQEIALANRSKKQFELYKRLYRPLHAELLKRTAKSPTKKAIARGLVNSDLQQQNKARSGGIHAAGLQIETCWPAAAMPFTKQQSVPPVHVAQHKPLTLATCRDESTLLASASALLASHSNRRRNSHVTPRRWRWKMLPTKPARWTTL